VQFWDKPTFLKNYLCVVRGQLDLSEELFEYSKFEVISVCCALIVVVW
jgi:hypothetical protein